MGAGLSLPHTPHITPFFSADEVDAQRKEAIKAKVNERLLRKWVRDLRASGAWFSSRNFSSWEGVRPASVDP